MGAQSRSIKLVLRITSSILKLLLNVVFYVLVIMLIVTVSKKGYEFTYQIYGPVSVDQEPGRDILFQINEGESSIQIARKLELYKIVKDQNAFFLKTKLEKVNIMPGTYELNSSMRYKEILSIITDYSASITVEDLEE